MHAFTPAAARAFPQLRPSDRVAAAERAASATMPTAAEEIWRYSRIEELDLDRFTPRPSLTTVDGAEGLVARDDEWPDVIGADAPDVFAELNAAFMSPLILRVPAGRVVTEPVVIEHVVNGEGTATFPRVVIDAGPDSEITVVERVTSAAGQRLLAPGDQRARDHGVADRAPAGGRRP
jgi:hypothetical protein